MLLGGRRDGRTADIWALGLVIFEIATLSFVWERQSSGIAGDVLSMSLCCELKNKHIDSKFSNFADRGEKAVHDFLRPVPTGYSPVIRKLLRKCLHSDPKKRPTPKDVRTVLTSCWRKLELQLWSTADIALTSSSESTDVECSCKQE